MKAANKAGFSLVCDTAFSVVSAFLSNNKIEKLTTHLLPYVTAGPNKTTGSALFLIKKLRKTFDDPKSNKIHTYLKTITTGFLDLPSPVTSTLLNDCIFKSKDVKNLFVTNETGEGLHSPQLEKVLKIIKEAAASADMKITQLTTPLLYDSEGLTGLVQSDLGKVDVTKYENGLSEAWVIYAPKMEEAKEKAKEGRKRKRDCPGGTNKSGRTKNRSCPSSTSTSSSTTTSTTSSTSTSADENVAPKANVAKDKQSPPAKPMVQG